jgi:hypothetical protein
LAQRPATMTFLISSWNGPQNGGLYCPPLIPARIWAIPRIPEESILAEGPAKSMKKFWRKFEQNSNSAGMQEFPLTELHRNGIRKCVGHRQQTNTMFINHHHHHQRRPPILAFSPPSRHRHHRQPGAASAHIRPHQPAHHERRGNATASDNLATPSHNNGHEKDMGTRSMPRYHVNEHDPN